MSASLKKDTEKHVMRIKKQRPQSSWITKRAKALMAQEDAFDPSFRPFTALTARLKSAHPEGAGKTSMMRKIKEVKDAERGVILNSIQHVRDVLEDSNQHKDTQLVILQKALSAVENTKGNMGYARKNISSLEKNRIALGLISSCKS